MYRALLPSSLLSLMQNLALSNKASKYLVTSPIKEVGFLPACKVAIDGLESSF
jgi:hypothetical protein